MDDPRVLRLADGRQVDCGRILRDLPGSRRVCEGQLDGRAVIVKRYLDPRRAAVHFQREVDGLAAFHAAGIAAPEVLYAGPDGDARQVIVLARIDGAAVLSGLWQDAAAGARGPLTGRMMELLACHHRAGICQTDLHLGNFLVDDDRIFSLDGGGVTVQAGPLDEGRSLENLALYCSQLTPDWDDLCLQQAARYAAARSWPEERVARPLPGLIGRARDYRWRKLREKIRRDCSAIVHRRSDRQESFSVRAYGAPLEALLADIDASCPADPARRLKDGNTATVWRTDVGGRPVVVKRYNVKGPLHGLMLTLKPSRASISWRNAHMLGVFGIATAPPVALVLQRRARFAPVAYFLAEDVAGVSLADWLDTHRDDPGAAWRIAGELGRLFVCLRRQRISHGDMKASNFIVRDGRLFVIDLDAMRRHRWAAGFARAWRRDMRRFAANWRDRPALAQIMREAIDAAGADPAGDRPGARFHP